MIKIIFLIYSSYYSNPLVVGDGDVAYNSRRRILSAIPVAGKIAYHLFNVDANASKTSNIVKLNRKSKWHSQHGTQKSN